MTAQKHDITYFFFNRKDSEIITKERDEACEEYLIQKYRPIINIDKNPEVLSIVREKRELCREIANR